MEAAREALASGARTQIFKALELWGFPQAEACYHLGYEMVGTKEGAFSSRKGNAPLYEDFEREAFRRATETVDAYRGVAS